MYIFGYKTTVFIQNLYILVKFLGKNFIFRVKSTTVLVFQDQMYIFGYKTTVIIQNVYILLNFLANTSFLVLKLQMFFLGGPNVHFWVQTYSFYPKFEHFSKMVWQKLHF